MRRRGFLILASGAVLALPSVQARATPEDVARAMREAIGDAVPKKGRIKLEIPVMVENGNAVSMTASIDALPGEVRAIHVFADGNPLPNVGNFRFGPATGRPRITTRIRLATSQTVSAVAAMADGTCWIDSVELLVTLAACIE
jgi:sulfur-oxidizing protein SoxY